MYSLVKATEDHIDYLVPRMRDADVVDLGIICSVGMGELLAKVLEVSEEVNTLCFNGEPLCVFGIVINSVEDHVGEPWGIAQPKASKHPVAMCRQGRKFTNKYLDKGLKLTTTVHSENELALNWLRFLGFTMNDIIDISPDTRYLVYEKWNREKCLSLS